MSNRISEISETQAKQLRTAICRKPLRPFDHIRDTPYEICQDCAKSAFAGKEYILKGMKFSVHEPIDWSAKDRPRSYRMYIQAWNFLEPFFVHYSEHQDAGSFAILQRHIDDWLEQFGTALAIEKDIANVADTLNDEGLFIGHPMAIAGRFYRLAYMIDVAARTKAVTDARFLRYIEALRWHAFYMSIDEYFLEKHNHGVQAALSQVVGADRLLKLAPRQAWLGYGHAMEETYAQGKRRLFRTMSQHVCSDGTHKEHSPHYHIVVANAIREPIIAGVINDAILKDIFAAMVEMSRWLFDFKGRVANMGDSDLDLLAAGAQNYQDENWPQEPQTKLFSQGGYWFVRGTAPAGQYYLAHQAAMHSRTHKHADTGSFIWQDRGRDILIDAGRYGYVGRTKVGSVLFNDGFWYDDPRRVYVESTRAHNSIAVDGKNHPRFRSKPFGSAMRASCEKDGIFACESSVPNLPGMSHFRVLVIKPGDWLLCIDTIRAADGQLHDMRQHFQIHPDWQLQQSDARSAEFVTGDKNRLYVSSVFDEAVIRDISRGQGEPATDKADALSGWWSPRHVHLEPCNSLCVEAKGSHVTMATLFSFDPARIDETFSSFNVTRRRLRFRWLNGDRTHSLIMEREQGKDGQPTLTIL